MIILKCSKCKEQLEVDDAFAGGVCRCVHCGALSQVPLQPTRVDRKGRPSAPPRMGQPVVASPEQEQSLQIAPTRAYVASRKRMGLLALVMMLASLAMVVIVIVWVLPAFMSSQTKEDKETQTPQPEEKFQSPYENAAVSGPAFIKLALPDGDVAYLLNVGNSMTQLGDDPNTAIKLSVKGVGNRKYTVVPWRQGNTPENTPPAYPTDGGLAQASGDTAGLEKWFYDFAALDAREPGPAAAEAVTRGATVLLVITRNDLEPADVQAMLAVTKDKPVRWLATAIDEGDFAPDAYPELAKLTGGAGNIQTVNIAVLRNWLKDAGTD